MNTDRMPPRSDDWEAAEVALREFLDDDDAVSVLQVLQSRGWFSPSESVVPSGLTAEKLHTIASLIEVDAAWEDLYPAIAELREWADALSTQETQ